MHYVSINEPVFAGDQQCQCKGQHACGCNGTALENCPCFVHLVMFQPYCDCGWVEDFPTKEEAEKRAREHEESADRKEAIV